MEKARLLVRTTQKNKIYVEIELANGKKMPFPQLKVTDTSLNGAEVNIEREAGQIVFVRTGDKVLFSGKRKARQYEHIRQVRNPAYAPYNFVPLNREVIGINPETPPDADKYYRDNYTGCIEVEIQALTPLYIRGTLTQEEIAAGRESKDKDQDKPDFFAPVDRKRIPGSSLRGMIRNLVEIVSYGKFHFVDKDRRLYYRGLADRSNLREEYQRRMSSYDQRSRRTQYNFSVGILQKSERKEKGEHFEIKSSGDKFKQILKKEARKRVQATGKEYSEFNYYKVDEGYIVVSGDMPNKKRDWLIYNPPDGAEIIPIPDDDVENYLGDRNRDGRVPNLIDLARKKPEKKPEGVPCFYVRWQDETGNERVSFGHTGMFRLAYEKTIGEHIFEDLMENEKIDFAEAIFGDEKKHAGRIFVEDAFLIDNQNDPLFSVETPQILSGPKPTTFQHYLVQNSDEVRQLNHYNSDTIIRGYKMYWHKSGENRIEKDKETIEKHSSQYTSISPVKAGVKFRGRIRFENFSGKELGALFFALDLPEGCAHKLGMGKPLGLGSVQITPTLYLSDRQKRYRDFFAEWDNRIEPAGSDLTEKFKREFEQYVLEKLGEPTDIQLWETERLRELLVMLHVDVGRELEKKRANRYMSISPQNEFKNRYILPRAISVPSASRVEGILNQLKKSPHRIEQHAKCIKRVEITGLWDRYEIDWTLDEKVNILVGINGSGKTTILELIKHALSGEYENPEKVRYPPKKLTIIFDNKEALEYERTVNGISCKSKPTSNLIPEFVSTFDAPLELEISDNQKKETTAEQIEKQLTTRLRERIGRLFLEIKKLPDEITKPYIEDLQHIIRVIFVQTKKEMEFVGKFKFTDRWLEHLNSSINVADELRESLKEMIGEDIFQPDEQFIGLLESKLGKANAFRLSSQILQYVEFMPDTPLSQAVFRLDDGQVLLPEQLSTGEKQILIILLTSLILKLRHQLTNDQNYVLIIDEPENSLHLKWQKTLINYIRRLNYDVQIIIATHAPAIIKKGYMEKTFEMNQIRQQMEI